MKLHNATAEIVVPDGKPGSEALARITHLGIGTHQDDLEFMKAILSAARLKNSRPMFAGNF